MQSHQDSHDYTTVNNPSIASTLTSAGNAGNAVSTLEPYVPPNVPHGLPHVVRYATLSSMDLPLEVRFLIIMIARFANVHGVASVANSTLGEICRIGSHHTVERWISLASDVGILRKEPGKGGKDRKSNSYTFLGADRSWAPLPVGQPDINPIVALAQARRIIEELQVKAARVDELEIELALLRNGHTNGHSGVTNGADEPPAGPPGDSYGTADSGTYLGTRGAIGHSEVTDGSPEGPPKDASHSYGNPDSASSQENRGAIGHPGVTNGSPEDPSEEAPHSYEPPDSGSSQGTHGAIGHSEVTNGSDEGQEYLARRDRVETLVEQHRSYYERSFDRRGVLGAIEFFSRSPENEQELIRQVRILDSGGDPRKSGSDPPVPTAGHPETEEAPDRYAVGECPDCGRPFGTYGGAEYCTDCTQRRRRESEA